MRNKNVVCQFYLGGGRWVKSVEVVGVGLV